MSDQIFSEVHGDCERERAIESAPTPQKVYIVWGKNYGEGRTIDGVFASRRVACEWLVDNIFNRYPYYASHTKEQKLGEALAHVDEYEVIP